MDMSGGISRAISETLGFIWHMRTILVEPFLAVTETQKTASNYINKAGIVMLQFYFNF